MCTQHREAHRQVTFPHSMDITNPRILKLKGVLFLLLGGLSAGIILIRSFDIETCALLAITIWAFCRFYYFAFYVLHEYADPQFKYAGLWDLSLYLLGWKANRRRRGDKKVAADDSINHAKTHRR